jgi:predicted dehydrogenase
MDKVRVGVIGVGALGRHHARLYGECEAAELVGIYDRNPDTAQKVATEFRIPVFDTPAALAAKAEALSVAVPTNLHHATVLPLLQQGRHVLVEKPIAASVVQARELVELAAARRLVLEVGHVERFNPVLECLQRVPGEPLFIEAHRLASYPPPRPGLPPRGTEVSVVLDLMIHDIDVVLSLVNSDIERIDSIGVPVLSPSEDIANARILFRNGCVANLTASRVSQERMRKIRVFKSVAYLSLDYQEQTGELAALTETGIQRMPVPVHEANALKAELNDFCRCVAELKRTGILPEPRVSGRQGLHALEVAEEILRVNTALRMNLPRRTFTPGAIPGLAVPPPKAE